jgi:hypothetical protein
VCSYTCDLCQGASNEYLSGHNSSTKTAFSMTVAVTISVGSKEKATLPTASADFLSNSHDLW